jgi:hypothetical protein
MTNKEIFKIAKILEDMVKSKSCFNYPEMCAGSSDGVISLYIKGKLPEWVFSLAWEVSTKSAHGKWNRSFK